MISAKKQRELELARRRRVEKESKKANLHEGHFKITEGDKVRWFKVWVNFYPKVHWMIEEVEELPRGEEKPIPGTRRKLDEKTKAKLESWL